MWTPKSFIIVGMVFLLLALSFGVYVWYQLQGLSNNVVETRSEPTERVLDTSQEEGTTSEPTQMSEEEVNVSPEVLSEEQKAFLRTFGIDPDSVTITKEMVSCAEEKLGSARIREIAEGATPTTLEGIRVSPCL